MLVFSCKIDNYFDIYFLTLQNVYDKPFKVKDYIEIGWYCDKAT